MTKRLFLKRLLFRTITLVLFAGLCLTATAQQRVFSQLEVDTERANIPLDEIFSGGPPPQGIPALGFSGDRTGSVGASGGVNLLAQGAVGWLEPQEPVIVLTLGDAARIYPLHVLTWHEIANDTLAGVPVAVTFCPLCNSALAFDRRIPLTAAETDDVLALNADANLASLDDDFLQAYAAQQTGPIRVETGLDATFGVSGLLYNSNLLMFDSATNTLWSQLLGEGNIGTLTDTRLLRYPAQIVSYAEAQDAYPDALVLSRDTGYSRNYGRNPYVGYDDVDSPAFLFRGESDGRLPPKARVVSLTLNDGVNDAVVAYPFETLREVGAVNDTVAGVALAVFWGSGTASALNAASIANSDDIGAVGVFRREVDGQTLTFQPDGDGFVDAETGSRWTLLGQAAEGPLVGAQLEPIVHDNTLWFAWAAFEPETQIYAAE